MRVRKMLAIEFVQHIFSRTRFKLKDRERCEDGERERTNHTNILILVSVYLLFKRTNLHGIFLFSSLSLSLSLSVHALFDVVVLFSLFFVVGWMLQHVEILTTITTTERTTENKNTMIWWLVMAYQAFFFWIVSCVQFFDTLCDRFTWPFYK